MDFMTGATPNPWVFYTLISIFLILMNFVIVYRNSSPSVAILSSLVIVMVCALGAHFYQGFLDKSAYARFVKASPVRIFLSGYMPNCNGDKLLCRAIAEVVASKVYDSQLVLKASEELGAQEGSSFPKYDDTDTAVHYRKFAADTFSTFDIQVELH